MIEDLRKSYIKISVVAAIGLGALFTSSSVFAQDDYWRQRVSLFEKLPVTENDIVFLGNSITDGGEFQELFGMENVLNRGIRSDRISGVKKRIEQVTDGQPKMIFLLIGINDVADSRNTPASIAGMYEDLVKIIREKTPNTQLYVQSVMPINNDFKRYKSLYGRETLLPEINDRLKDIAVNNGAVYIDLWPVLADSITGKMHKEFTTDGLHLSGAGYKAWAEAVRPFVEGLVGTAIDSENPDDSSDNQQISIIKKVEM